MQEDQHAEKIRPNLRALQPLNGSSSFKPLEPQYRGFAVLNRLFFFFFGGGGGGGGGGGDNRIFLKGP